MTTTSIPHTVHGLLTTDRTTRPDRRPRPYGTFRRIGSFLARRVQELSVANETPSEQVMRDLSSADRPVR